jgi:hypothetical protein
MFLLLTCHLKSQLKESFKKEVKKTVVNLKCFTILFQAPSKVNLSVLYKFKKILTFVNSRDCELRLPFSGRYSIRILISYEFLVPFSVMKVYPRKILEFGIWVTEFPPLTRFAEFWLLSTLLSVVGKPHCLVPLQ